MEGLILHFVIGFPLGILYANGFEWVVHKYLLHRGGKKKGHAFNFHWFEHHNKARRFGFYDDDFIQPLNVWNAQTKELVAFIPTILIHLPFFWVAPGFATATLYGIFNYLYKHRKAHLDVEWGKKNLPWHYDHHMAPNQDANWCVTKPWFDWILGTREPYLGTMRQQMDLRRREAREQQPAREATESRPPTQIAV